MNSLIKNVYDQIPKANQDKITFNELKSWRESLLKKVNSFPMRPEGDSLVEDKKQIDKSHAFFVSLFKSMEN